jgi:tetratricopeptide (TPR) repeat protein
MSTPSSSSADEAAQEDVRQFNSVNSVTDSVVLGNVIQIRELHGNLTVSFNQPGYHIEPFPPASQAPEHEHARGQPSRLLMARHEVVPFEGRQQVLADLSAWMTDKSPPISVRLIHAPGGQGKSRLAAHLARNHAAGWQVWRARLPLPSALSGAGQHIDSSAEGLLVIVDYADRWPLSSLRALIADLRVMMGHLPRAMPLRVLLLARSAGWWWNAVENWLDTELGVPSDAVVLLPLGFELSLAQIFRSALKAFTRALRVPEFNRDIVLPVVDTPGFDQVLTVHMAALATVDAWLHGEVPPTEPHRVTDYLLKRERRHWHEWHVQSEEPLHTSPHTISRAVCLATLNGPLPHPSGVDVLRRTHVSDSPEACGQIIEDHAKLYPAQDPGTVLEPLYPDRLGEDFIAVTTPGHSHAAGGVVDPWTETAVRNLLTRHDEDANPAGRSSQVVTVLVETAHRWPHVAECHLYPLLKDYPALALHIDAPTLTRLSELPDVDFGALEAVESVLSTEHRTDVSSGLAAIAVRLAGHRMGQTQDPAERASIQDSLTLTLLTAGLHEQCLVAAREAVEIRRMLATTDPAAHEPALVVSLANFGTVLLTNGRVEEALGTDRETVRLARRLAASNSDLHSSTLASALVGLGNRATEAARGHGAVELWIEALTATSEAVDLLRQLPDHDQSPLLALALNNLGNPLAVLGRPDEALSVSEEAVRISRGLTATKEALHAPLLAMAVRNVAIRLEELGRSEEAFLPAKEAVQLYRGLTAANPIAHEDAFLESLRGLRLLLFGLGRHEEALSPTEEHVAIMQQKASLNPANYQPALAVSLYELSAVLLLMDRLELALEAARESVRAQRVWAALYPIRHWSTLFQALYSVATLLTKLERWDEIQPVADEALNVYHALFTHTGHEPPPLITMQATWLHETAAAHSAESTHALGSQTEQAPSRHSTARFRHLLAKARASVVARRQKHLDS